MQAKMDNQLGLDLYTSMERQLLVDQMMYRKPIRIVRQFFEYFMQLRPQGAIRITPNYPIGWIAEVPSEDKIWTVECNRGDIKLTGVADLIDYTSNGRFITGATEDIKDNMNGYYQQCHYGGMNNDIPQCRDFCDEEKDGSDFRCRCCPWILRSDNDYPYS